MSEAETRQLIDAQLRITGWEADTDTLIFKGENMEPGDRASRNYLIKYKQNETNMNFLHSKFTKVND